MTLLAVNVGDQMECALLGRDNKKTGKYILVEIREVKRQWQTGEVESARVRYCKHGKDCFIWVQRRMLRPLKVRVAAEGNGK